MEKKKHNWFKVLVNLVAILALLVGEIGTYHHIKEKGNFIGMDFGF
ncbi:hypothetical protein HMPREF9176_0007 [Streptococcus downei F0415]|nr:hypothetical protein [Streptococcus downei]EFQ57734.1 hypothetical protein HMPREF9176_0007 [Streptococcus downei F0415]